MASISSSTSLSSERAATALLSTKKELPVESAGFSESFLERIRASNREKSDKTPLATVLQAEYGAFELANLGAEYNYLTLAASYRIAMKIQRSADIEAALKEIAKGFKLSDVLVLDGHGSKSQITFGNEDREDRLYTLDHVKPESYQYLEQGAPIFVTGCETGQALAEKIAAASKRPTTAPRSLATTNRSYYQICEKHGLELVCFNREGQQMEARFFQGQKNLSCQNEEAHKAKRSFLYNEAKNGNSSSFDFLLNWNREERNWDLEEVAEHYSQLINQKNKTAWRPFYIYVCREMINQSIEFNPSHAQKWIRLFLKECEKALDSDSFKKEIKEEIAATKKKMLQLISTASEKKSDQ